MLPQEYGKLTVPAYVLTSPKRTPLVKPWLAGDDATFYVNPDWEVPAGALIQPPFAHAAPLVTHYRVFRGHQEMMKLFVATGKPVGLFFEDDAVPNTPDYKKLVNACVTNMGSKSVFNTYGRLFDLTRFAEVDRLHGRPVYSLRKDAVPLPCGSWNHVLGSLAYLMTREAADSFSKRPFTGYPIDVEIPDTFKDSFAFLEPSPWDHDRSQGSLVENKPAPSRRPVRRIRK